jgi:hypothetical protein
VSDQECPIPRILVLREIGFDLSQVILTDLKEALICGRESLLICDSEGGGRSLSYFALISLQNSLFRRWAATSTLAVVLIYFPHPSFLTVSQHKSRVGYPRI